MYTFQKAIPVWAQAPKNKFNQFLGFRTDVEFTEPTQIQIAIAAQSFYRLFVNGEMKAHGPSRTAKGYCRVDEVSLTVRGKVQVGIEVAALSKEERFSYDHTMDPGLLAVEITHNGKVLSATGQGNWWVRDLDYRVPGTDLISHCRGIAEYFRMESAWNAWQTEPDHGNRPVSIDEIVSFLPRRAPYATYRTIPMQRLEKVRSMIPSGEMIGGTLLNLSRLVNQKWYATVREQDTFVEQLLKETEIPFSGKYQKTGDRITLEPGSGADAFLFSIPKSEIGFVHLKINVEKPTVMDIIPSDHADQNGFVRANTYSVRYELAPGEYDLTTWEPKLAKYIKVILRTEGRVAFTYPELLDYSYPDEQDCVFSCSDGQLNRIHEGARRTLRLNTLDIFMDCPNRERGGWLCDSWFTSQAAWQMFGDLGVEKDFIENFMLTNPKEYADGFFPEVYPSKKRDQDAGIQNWSFWLLLELTDYFRRSGDGELVKQSFERVRIFLDTLMGKVGESGLFENMKPLFVDWSLSNAEVCLYPISAPVNCLICTAFEQMGTLYGVDRWLLFAATLREKLDSFAPKWMFESDGFTYRDGQFIPNGVRTESGAALSLFSGFGLENHRFVGKFVETMGTCPQGRPDPNVGKASLFIGLAIRFVVLARLGKIDQLVRELKDVYLPQLDFGSGTLFEVIHAFSGCHGFNGIAGVLLSNHVLGLGQPMELTKTIAISPEPGELTWAYGNAKCSDGEIRLEWRANHDLHVLEMSVVLPDGWKTETKLPYGWTAKINIVETR